MTFSLGRDQAPQLSFWLGIYGLYEYGVELAVSGFSLHHLPSTPTLSSMLGKYSAELCSLGAGPAGLGAEGSFPPGAQVVDTHHQQGQGTGGLCFPCSCHTESLPSSQKTPLRASLDQLRVFFKKSL